MKEDDHASSLKLKEKKGKKLDFDESNFPSALNKLLFYSREGEAHDLVPGLVKVYEFVLRTCEIPEDFEANHKYGPKSGISYEERLVNAFCFKMLPHVSPKADDLHPKLKRLVARRKWKDASDLVSAAA